MRCMDLAFVFMFFFKMLLSEVIPLSFYTTSFLILENFLETVLLEELPPLVMLTQNKCGLKDCL